MKTMPLLIAGLATAMLLAACRDEAPRTSALRQAPTQVDLEQAAAKLQYWDQKPTSTRTLTGSCGDDYFRAAAQGYMHPEMMVLGDSLYNGVSSLRLNWWLAEWSAPAQIAMGLGLIDLNADLERQGTNRRFWVPQYPSMYDGTRPGQGIAHFTQDYPSRSETWAERGIQAQYSIYNPNTPQFGFDLEKATLFGLGSDKINVAVRTLLGLKDNWQPPNRRLFNDNIAFQGADTTDLLDSSAMALLAELDKQEHRDNFTLYPNTTMEYLVELRNGVQASSERAQALFMGFFAINGAYVLNPMNDRCIASLTPVSQVELRRPKRVLVNIGANNGVWKVGFGLMRDIKPSEKEAPNYTLGVNGTCPATSGSCYRRRTDDTQLRSINDDIGAVYLQDMQRMIERLSRVEGLKYIYVNSLVPPSRLANLMPSDGTGRLLPPDAIRSVRRLDSDKRYYEYYMPVFSVDTREVISGDRSLRRTNSCDRQTQKSAT